MTDFERAVMGRDELSPEEARRLKAEARASLYDILESGGSYEEVEEMMADDYGLEMDYILDIM